MLLPKHQISISLSSPGSPNSFGMNKPFLSVDDELNFSRERQSDSFDEFDQTFSLIESGFGVRKLLSERLEGDVKGMSTEVLPTLECLVIPNGGIEGYLPIDFKFEGIFSKFSLKE